MSLLLAAWLTLAADTKPLFEDGDLVVLLGGTLVERAQEYGHWEAALQLAHPDKTLRFRNLGWSGDTVWAESRGQFDPPEEGYKRMIEQVTALKPDVIILGYGNAEAFAGPEGLEAFETQYRKLIGDLPESRFVVFAPVPMGPAAGGKLATQHNRLVHAYANRIEHVAADIDAAFVDWDLSGFAAHLGDIYEANGLHLSEFGYGVLSSQLVPREGDDEQSDSEPIDFATANCFSDSRTELLAAIRRKNRLVFDRWRPQNVTYLFGFRKHEQGQNAAEIPRFDPLIEAADAEIDRIKRELAGTAE